MYTHHKRLTSNAPDEWTSHNHDRNDIHNTLSKVQSSRQEALHIHHINTDILPQFSCLHSSYTKKDITRFSLPCSQHYIKTYKKAKDTLNKAKKIIPTYSTNLL